MPPAAGLVAGEVLLVGAGRRGRRAGGLAHGVGQGDQVVGGGGRRREIAVVAHELPASGGGEAAGMRLAQVVRVRLGERRQGADDGGRIAVDVGQCGDRLSGTAVPGAAPWGPHGGTLSPRGLAWGALTRDTPTHGASRFGR